ncbi:MAG: 2-C-methyl-D-erythritol 4-phosphate cytidylyltransferase [Bacillota bacterium]|nr:2-C-methyl-D-erythritol 4-phosphate cytidylyltransferase [Bacillota bacterium]
MRRTGAVVVAAGRGLRYAAGENKAFAPVLGRPLLAYTLQGLERAGVGRYVVVVGEGEVRRCLEEAIRPFGLRPAAVVPGGARRSDSVRAGLRALGRGEGLEVVLVHDGARPLASPELWQRVAAAAFRSGAAIPVLPVSDTVKRVVAERVAETVPRGSLFLAQTPQGFRAELLWRAHGLLMNPAAAAAAPGRDSAAEGGPDASDDAALVEALGWPVTTVPGEPWNLKVTYPVDRFLVEAWIRGRSRAPEAAEDERATGRPEAGLHADDGAGRYGAGSG